MKTRIEKYWDTQLGKSKYRAYIGRKRVYDHGIGFRTPEEAQQAIARVYKTLAQEQSK